MYCFRSAMQSAKYMLLLLSACTFKFRLPYSTRLPRLPGISLPGLHSNRVHACHGFLALLLNPFKSICQIAYLHNARPMRASSARVVVHANHPPTQRDTHNTQRSKVFPVRHHAGVPRIPRACASYPVAKTVSHRRRRRRFRRQVSAARLHKVAFISIHHSS